MGSTLDLLRRLTDAKVEYVLVGGMAAIAHGASTVTENADVCIRFDLATLAPLFKALAPLHPRQRMNPARPLLGDDPKSFVGYKNLLGRPKDVRAAEELDLVRMRAAKK